MSIINKSRIAILFLSLCTFDLWAQVDFKVYQNPTSSANNFDLKVQITNNSGAEIDPANYAIRYWMTNNTIASNWKSNTGWPSSNLELKDVWDFKNATCTGYIEAQIQLYNYSNKLANANSVTLSFSLSTINNNNVIINDDYSYNTNTSLLGNVEVLKLSGGSWTHFAGVYGPQNLTSCPDLPLLISVARTSTSANVYSYDFTVKNPGSKVSDLKNYRFIISIPYSSTSTSWAIQDPSVSPNLPNGTSMALASTTSSNGIFDFTLGWNNSVNIMPGETFQYTGLKITNYAISLPTYSSSSVTYSIPPVLVYSSGKWTNTSSTPVSSSTTPSSSSIPRSSSVVSSSTISSSSISISSSLVQSSSSFVPQSSSVVPSSSAGSVCAYTAPTGAGTTDDLSNWTNVSKIVIDVQHSGFSINSTLCDYPLLVRLTSQNFDFSQSTHGADLRFTDSQGRLLHHQVDAWDKQKKQAAIWVRIPEIQPNAQTEFRMFYGNTFASSTSKIGDPWANGYAMVHHYGNYELTDATTQGNNGTLATSSSTTPLTGTYDQIGPSRRGVGNYTVEDKSSLDLDNFVTMSAWVLIDNLKADDSEMTILRKRGKANDEDENYTSINYQMNLGDWYTEGDSRLCGLFYDGGWSSNCGGEAVKEYSWRYVTVSLKETSEGVHSRTYVDGEYSGYSNDLYSGKHLNTNNAKLYVGGDHENGNLLLGNIDELRISNVVRSEDWIRLDYQTQRPDVICVRVQNSKLLANQWSYTKNIVIDTKPESGEGISEDIYEGVVPIRLNSNHLDFALASADGSDVRFTDANDYLLDHEIELWDAQGTNAIIWVKIPKIQISSLQTIKMHFGNSAAINLWYPSWVWEGARAVYHFGNLSVLAVDKSSFGNHGSFTTGNTTSPIPLQDGMLGGAVSIVGSPIRIPYHPSLSLNHSLHLDAWVNSTSPSAYSGENTILRKRVSGTAKVNYQFTLGNYMVADDNRIELLNGYEGTYYNSNSTSHVDLNTWSFVSGNWNWLSPLQSNYSYVAQTSLFKNGQIDGSVSNVNYYLEPTNSFLYLGSGISGESSFQGKLSEIRIFGYSRRPAQIEFDYKASKGNSKLVKLDVVDGAAYSEATYYFGNGLENDTEVRYGKDGKLTATIHNFPGASGREVMDESANLSKEFYVKNYLGSVITSVDENGTRESDLRDYFAFGREKVVKSISTSKVTPSFTGKEFDVIRPNAANDGNGLYYFGARYYDADIGMWTSPDPKRQFVSPYSYTGGNPTNAVDPDGKDAIVLNRQNGAGGFGHNAILIGNEKSGFNYYSRDGKDAKGNSIMAASYYSSLDEFWKSGDFTGVQTMKERYNRSTRISTTEKQDAMMVDEANERFIEEPDYGGLTNNCSELVADVLQSIGFDGLDILTPNSQFKTIQSEISTEAEHE